MPPFVLLTHVLPGEAISYCVDACVRVCVCVCVRAYYLAVNAGR